MNITGKDSGFRSVLGKVRGALGTFAKTAAIGVGLGIGAVALGLRALIGSHTQAISLAERQIQAEQRLAAVLRATGGAAGFTANQLKIFASQLQSITTIGDEEILETMALLGTFKAISGDVFKRTTKAAADLSAAGFGGMSQAALQLAKAVEDPTRGMSMLRRVGVTFSKQQEEQIKGMQKVNNLLGAQDLLLKAVEGQVKGVAEELAKTDIGKYKQLENTLGDLREEVGKAILPLFVKFREVQVAAFEKILPFIKQWAQTFSVWSQVVIDNWQLTWEIIKNAQTVALLSMENELRKTVNVFQIVMKELFGVPVSQDETLNALFGGPELGKALRKQAGLLKKMKELKAKFSADPKTPSAGGGLAAPTEIPKAIELKLPKGLIGFDTFAQKMQDAFLKQDDPQIKMLGLLDADKVAQKQQLSALETIAANTATTGNAPALKLAT